MRTRARDFYDLWSVLGTYQEGVDLTDFGDRLREKCQLQHVDFYSPEAFFDPRIVDNVLLEGENSLESLVRGLPPLRHGKGRTASAGRDSPRSSGIIG